MKKAIILFFVLMMLVVSGCKPDQEISSTQVQETATTLPASETPAPTEKPSQTPAPTETVEPTSTHTAQPTATSTPPSISAENARQLNLTQRSGGGAMVGVALSPDASQVAVLTTQKLLLFDVANASLVWEVEAEKVFQEIAFSEDGTILTTMTRGGSVQRWNAKNGTPAGDPLPIQPNTRDVAISGNGAVLITLDNFDQTYLWDTTTGEQMQTNNGLAYPFGAIEVAAAPNGELFLNSGIDSKISYQIRLWDVRRGRFLIGLRGLPGEVYDIQFSPDSKYVTALSTRVAGGLHGMQNLYLWRAETGALLDTVDLALDVSTHTFLGDGATVLAGTASGKVLIVSFRFGERYTYGYIKDQFFAHETALIDLSSSADGLKFASAAVDGSVKVWNITNGETLFSSQVEGLSLQSLTEEWVYENLTVFSRSHNPGTTVSSDGKLFVRTAADLHSIDIIDASTHERIKNLQIELTGYYASPVFSPDGKTVAAAFAGNKIIFWDVESGLDILRLTTQHIKPITRLKYSPDGSQLASLSDGELFVWEPASASLKHKLTAFDTFTFSPDGTLIITDAQEEGVNVLDAQTGRKQVLLSSYYVNDLAITNDNAIIAVAGYRSPVRYQQDNLVYFLNIADRKFIRTIELAGYPSEVMDLVYSPDNSLIVSLDLYGSIYVWNAQAGTLLARFEEQVLLPADIYFSSDSRTILITAADNTVQQYQVTP